MNKYNGTMAGNKKGCLAIHVRYLAFRQPLILNPFRYS